MEQRIECGTNLCNLIAIHSNNIRIFILNKIKKLVEITFGHETVERLLHDIWVDISREELMLIVLRLTGKDIDELSEIDLTYQDIKSIYQSSNEYKNLPVALQLVNLDESIIPKEADHWSLDHAIKYQGERWIVHKNDADPHPSSPHAHNYEKGIKLHLGNGDIYRRRELLSNIGKKNLMMIREKLTTISLPPLEV